MFKAPTAPKKYSSAFFKTQKRSPEEKALIKILRDEHREEARQILSEDGEQPTQQDVEGYLDCFIEEAYETGMIQKVLNRYLAQKIAEQRAVQLK